MSEIGRKIMEIRHASKLSRKAFSEKMGEPESKLQAIEIGRQRADHEFLAKITKAYQLDANWLLDDDLGIDNMDDVAVNSSEFLPIPRYDVEVSAGGGTIPANTSATGFYGFNREWIKRRGLSPEQLSVVAVKGDSMIPSLNNGDLVLIDHAQAEIVDGYTFVVRFDDQLFVKKLQMIPGGILHLISANNEYPPITLDLAKDKDAIALIGRVVASMHEWR